MNDYATDPLMLPDPQRPTIQSDVLELSGQNQLQFFCDFAPESDTDHNFTITWFVLHDHSQRREIWTSGPRNYDRFFRNETAITEHILQSRGYTQLPYTVRPYKYAFECGLINS